MDTGIHYKHISLLTPYKHIVHITHIVHLNPIWLGHKVPIIFACIYLQFNVYQFHWSCVYTVTLY